MADFRIVSKPSYIALTCPHCEEDIKIPWKDVDAPECWSDQWDPVECPECKKEIDLNDWEYD